MNHNKFLMMDTQMVDGMVILLLVLVHRDHGKDGLIFTNIVTGSLIAKKHTHVLVYSMSMEENSLKLVFI